MFYEKLKYVRLRRFNEIIVFPEVIQHSEFKHFDCVSAGFCSLQDNKVTCYGESTSLKLKSDPQDSTIATYQFYPEI